MAFKNKLKKNLWKIKICFNLSFFVVQWNIKPKKIPWQLEQWKSRKTIGKS